jgi:hypothetical protein
MSLLFLAMVGMFTKIEGAPVAQPATAQRAPAVASTSIPPRIGPLPRDANAWRYVFHQGRWWYWFPSERWSYFDGRRWVDLDSLNQPLTGRRDLAQSDATRLKTLPRAEDLRFRFGQLPTPRSWAGSFGVGSAAPVTGRNFAGSFGAGAALPHALLSPPTEPGITMVNPYGPDSEYGAYGSTDPFRGGLHTGAGGNYGYGLGAQRLPMVGGSRQSRPFNQSR